MSRNVSLLVSHSSSASRTMSLPPSPGSAVSLASSSSQTPSATSTGSGAASALPQASVPSQTGTPSASVTGTASGTATCSASGTASAPESPSQTPLLAHVQNAAVADASALAAQTTFAAAAGAIAAALCLAALAVLVLARRSRRRHTARKVGVLLGVVDLPPLTPPRPATPGSDAVGEGPPLPAHWAYAMPREPEPPMLMPEQSKSEALPSPLPPLGSVATATDHSLDAAPPPPPPPANATGAEPVRGASVLAVGASIALTDAEPTVCGGAGGVVPCLRPPTIGHRRPSRVDEERSDKEEEEEEEGEDGPLVGAVALEPVSLKAGAAPVQTVSCGPASEGFLTQGSTSDEPRAAPAAAGSVMTTPQPLSSRRSVDGSPRGGSPSLEAPRPLSVDASLVLAAVPAAAPRVEEWGHALDWLLNGEAEGSLWAAAPPGVTLAGDGVQPTGATSGESAPAPAASAEAPLNATGTALVGLDPQLSERPSTAAAELPATPAADDDLDMIADVFFAPQPLSGGGALANDEWLSPGPEMLHPGVHLDVSRAAATGGVAVGSWFSGPRSPAAAAWSPPATLLPQDAWGAAARRRAQSLFDDNADASPPSSPGAPASRSPLRAPLQLSPHRAAGASPPLLARTASLRSVSVRAAVLQPPGSLHRGASQRSLLAAPALARLGGTAMPEPYSSWRTGGYSDAFVDELLDAEGAADEATAPVPAALPSSVVDDRWVAPGHPHDAPVAELLDGAAGRSSRSNSTGRPALFQQSRQSLQAASQWQRLHPTTLPQSAQPPPDAFDTDGVEDAVDLLNT